MVDGRTNNNTALIKRKPAEQRYNDGKCASRPIIVQQHQSEAPEQRENAGDEHQGRISHQGIDDCHKRLGLRQHRGRHYDAIQAKESGKKHSARGQPHASTVIFIFAGIDAQRFCKAALGFRYRERSFFTFFDDVSLRLIRDVVSSMAAIELRRKRNCCNRRELQPRPRADMTTGSCASGRYSDTQTPRPIGIVWPAFFRAA